MSELTELLTGKKESPQSQAFKRELERYMNDKVLIHNPTTVPYNIQWDGFLHTVPSKDVDAGYGKGNKVIERYLAMKYMKEMENWLLQDSLNKAVKVENERRKKTGQGDMDHYQERLVFETSVINGFRQPENIKKIRSSLYLGVVQEFGKGQTTDINVPMPSIVNPIITDEMQFMFNFELEKGQAPVGLEVKNDLPGAVVERPNVEQQVPATNVTNLEELKTQAVSQLISNDQE